MTQLRELVSGDGSLDTALRGLALAAFLLISAALIWTTVSVRADAHPGYETIELARPTASDGVQIDSPFSFSERKATAFRKEQRQ